MADIQSALASVYEPGRKGAGSGDPSVTIAEITGRDIVQLAVWPGTVSAVARKVAKQVGVPLPQDTRTASSKAKTAVFRVATSRQGKGRNPYRAKLEISER